MDEPQTLYEAVERLSIAVDNLKEALKEEWLSIAYPLFLIWWIFLHVWVLLSTLA